MNSVTLNVKHLVFELDIDELLQWAEYNDALPQEYDLDWSQTEEPDVEVGGSWVEVRYVKYASTTVDIDELVHKYLEQEVDGMSSVDSNFCQKKRHIIHTGLEKGSKTVTVEYIDHDLDAVVKTYGRQLGTKDMQFALGVQSLATAMDRVREQVNPILYRTA